MQSAHHRLLLLGWTRLLERALELDLDHCASFGSELKITAAILEQPVIAKILAHLELQQPGRIVRVSTGLGSWRATVEQEGRHQSLDSWACDPPRQWKTAFERPIFFSVRWCQKMNSQGTETLPSSLPSPSASIASVAVLVSPDADRAVVTWLPSVALTR